MQAARLRLAARLLPRYLRLQAAIALERRETGRVVPVGGDWLLLPVEGGGWFGSLLGGGQAGADMVVTLYAALVMLWSIGPVCAVITWSPRQASAGIVTTLENRPF